MTLYKRVIVVCVGIMLVLAIGNSLRLITRVKPAMSDFTGLPTIVIDPGHGGEDGGAVAGNVIEKDINLAIGLALRDMFTASGFNVVMTRDTDISIHDGGVKGTRKQKISDLKNRLKLAESYPDAVFLSIHQNKFTSSRSWGTQVFYSPNNPRSEQLAKILQEDFVLLLQPDNHRKTKKAGKNLYLMYEVNCPAVLVECGFISNPNDAALLTDFEYQTKVAFTVYHSVARFLGMGERPLEDKG